MPGVLATQVRRQVRIGGATKAELLQRLAGVGVQVNAIGRRLFADERFRTIEATQIVDCLQTTVAALGLPGGGTFAQATRAASEMGLSLCPLELGPHLRLELMDQPEGPVDAPQMQGRAPPGSVTIASAPLGEDDTPKRGSTFVGSRAGREMKKLPLKRQ